MISTETLSSLENFGAKFVTIFRLRVASCSNVLPSSKVNIMERREMHA